MTESEFLCVECGERFEFVCDKCSKNESLSKDDVIRIVKDVLGNNKAKKTKEKSTNLDGKPRKPIESSYHEFVKQKMKEGKGIAEAAKLWREMKAKDELKPIKSEIYDPNESKNDN